jgi:asparagine synthase (glutamine-hydrolysing)
MRQHFFLSGAVAYFEEEKDSILARGFRERHSLADSADIVAPLYAEIEAACPHATFLQKMTYIELQLRLPELLLMRVDKMTMANSIEVRVPFLDRDLVDFALSVPDSFKLRNGISKEPVKRLAAQSVPAADIYRKKTGFGAPIREWFAGELGAEMRVMLRQDAAEWGGFFNIEELRRRLDAKPASANEAFQLWVVFNLMCWRRNFGPAAIAA